MLTSIFVTGLGGQGVVTFARLLTGYLIEQGLKTSLFNATGMAQRGGRVTSEIRISSDPELQSGGTVAYDNNVHIIMRASPIRRPSSKTKTGLKSSSRMPGYFTES